MRNTVYAILLGLIIFRGDLIAQSPQFVTAPEDLTTYVITQTTGGVPIIRLMTTGPNPPIEITIDNSKYCEYFMAALMMLPLPGKIEKVTIGSDTRYRLLVHNVPRSAPMIGGTNTDYVVNRLPSNLCGIGFEKKGTGELVFEVMLHDSPISSSYNDWQYYDFILTPIANYKQKIQFDYIVSAVLNFKEMNNGYSPSLNRPQKILISPTASTGGYEIGTALMMRSN